jgi:hypothetical protein
MPAIPTIIDMMPNADTPNRVMPVSVLANPKFIPPLDIKKIDTMHKAKGALLIMRATPFSD